MDIFDEMNRDQLKLFCKRSIGAEVLQVKKSMSDDDIRNKIRSYYSQFDTLTYVLLKDGHTALILNDEQAKERWNKHDCTMTSSSDTLQNLLMDLDMKPACSCCGNIYKSTWVEPVRSNMLKRNMCHGCNIWTERAEAMPGKEDVMIAGGYYYTICPDDPKAYFKGHGGSEFKFKRFDTGEIVISHNVWSGGDVPEHMKHLLPNNAELIR